jgi:hypothetical protein
MKRAALAASVLALAACDSEGTALIEAPAAAAPRPPSEWRAPVRTGCLPGDAPDGAGGCVAPGVRACAPGFEADGSGGCNAILPASACPRGSMAIPGERVCREIAPCGAGTWGDITTDASTQFVDGAYGGGANDGTRERPWTKISDALKAAAPGATVAVAAGVYDELVDVVSKRVVLWGRCPSMVEIHGASAGLPAVVVRKGGDASVVRGVAITGSFAGVLVSDANDVLFDRVWIHDVQQLALATANTWGPASATLRGSLVEDSPVVAQVSTLSASLTVESSVVRAGRPISSAKEGLGVEAEQAEFDAPRAKLVVRSSVVEQNATIGVMVSGSEAEIVDSVVRDTRSAGDGTLGRGLQVQAEPGVARRSSVVVRGSLFERNREVGVLDVGSDLEVYDTVIRDTRASAVGAGGRGLQAQRTVNGSEKANLRMARSTIERSREGGLSIISAQAALESILVRDTESRLADRRAGIGLAVQYDVRPGADADTVGAIPSNVEIWHSRIERSRVVGISLLGSSLRMDGVHVDDTRGQESDGLFGDGIAALGGPLETTIEVRNSRVTRSRRAALANFGSHAILEQTDLACNTLDLDGESFPDGRYSFEDRGGNACGCAPNTTFCKVLSANLQPPVPK